MDEELLVRRAIGLAARARVSGNPPFGALIVRGKSGEIIREDVNTSVTDNDLSAHPEFKLACWVAAHSNAFDVDEVTLVTSCEPCAMCRYAIERSGIPQVIYALNSAGLAKLRQGRAVPHTATVYKGPRLLAEASAAIGDFYIIQRGD